MLVLLLILEFMNVFSKNNKLLIIKILKVNVFLVLFLIVFFVVIIGFFGSDIMLLMLDGNIKVDRVLFLMLVVIFVVSFINLVCIVFLIFMNK